MPGTHVVGLSWRSPAYWRRQRKVIAEPILRYQLVSFTCTAPRVRKWRTRHPRHEKLGQKRVISTPTRSSSRPVNHARCAPRYPWLPLNRLLTKLASPTSPNPSSSLLPPLVKPRYATATTIYTKYQVLRTGVDGYRVPGCKKYHSIIFLHKPEYSYRGRGRLRG